MSKNDRKIILLAKALSNKKRLKILHWLQNPSKNFPSVITSMKGESGIASITIARKLGVREPTASEHLKILQNAGLIKSIRAGTWTLYQRVPNAVDNAGKLLSGL